MEWKGIIPVGWFIGTYNLLFLLKERTQVEFVFTNKAMRTEFSFKRGGNNRITAENIQ